MKRGLRGRKKLKDQPIKNRRWSTPPSPVSLRLRSAFAPFIQDSLFFPLKMIPPLVCRVYRHVQGVFLRPLKNQPPNPPRRFGACTCAHARVQAGVQVQVCRCAGVHSGRQVRGCVLVHVPKHVIYKGREGWKAQEGGLDGTRKRGVGRNTRSFTF